MQTDLTDKQIQTIWESIGCQDDPSGRKFANAFARAIINAHSSLKARNVAHSVIAEIKSLRSDA